MAARARPAAFIDRDGVINAELEYVHLLPGVVQALRQLAGCGYALVVITNQAGIAKGLYGEAEYAALTQHMQALFVAQGVSLAGVYHCPHHPQGSVPAYAIDCACRKPAPGMLLRAAVDLSLDLRRSVLVGDKPSDTAAGRAAGVRWTVLVESGHRLPDDTSAVADHRCANLAQASHWVCAHHDEPSPAARP
jgi:D-glycero-D-manno-heptose 1,7-bisphosphate phosphatase